MAEMHLHHRIPRHAGGGDEPENLVLLTVPEHAEAHRKLYEEHGNIKDYCAWKGLEGIIGKEEIVRLLMDPTGRTHSEETKEKIAAAHKGKKKHTEESRALISAARKGKQLSEEHKQKISKSLEGNTHSLGHKVSEETKAKLSAAGKGNQRAKGKGVKGDTPANRARAAATKARWAKWREERGLPPKE
jgi:hypothetical protein